MSNTNFYVGTMGFPKPGTTKTKGNAMEWYLVWERAERADRVLTQRNGVTSWKIGIVDAFIWKTPEGAADALKHWTEIHAKVEHEGQLVVKGRIAK